MRVFIIGYGEMFKALIYGAMSAGCDIVGVFRHENVIMNPFRRFLYDIFFPSDDFNIVKSLGLKNIYAQSVNSKKFIKQLRKLQPDVILVGSWSEKFTSEVINIPKIACINTHPSLLPEYRGPNPYIQVLLNGEKTTGVTFHLMDLNYDTGEIIYQKETDILPDDTGCSLKIKCCNLAQNSVKDLLVNLYENIEKSVKQDNDKASYQPRIELSQAILKFKDETSEQIVNRIKAFYPWLNCFISFKDEFFNFTNYEVLPDYSTAEPCTITDKSDNSLSIVCKDLKVIKFGNVKLVRPFCKIFTKFYLKNFVEINSKVN